MGGWVPVILVRFEQIRGTGGRHRHVSLSPRESFSSVWLHRVGVLAFRRALNSLVLGYKGRSTSEILLI